MDFVLRHSGQGLPPEVKAEENLNAKSIKSFVNTCQLAYDVRTSMSDYREQQRLLNLPLYAISQLWNVCDNFHPHSNQSPEMIPDLSISYHLEWSIFSRSRTAICFAQSGHPLGLVPVRE